MICHSPRPSVSRPRRRAGVATPPRRAATPAALPFSVLKRTKCNESPVKTSCKSKKLARCYHSNQQYSIIALTDNAGAITERYAYSAYGEPVFVSATGTVLADSAEDNRYTYTGREWDEGQGLYHFRARMYDAGSGRFLGRDPIGYVGSPSNLYSAFFALSGMDPNGWTCITRCENDCRLIYPHWYQWHLFAGCVAGCPLGSRGQDFTLCNYVNSWSDCYKDGLQCACGFASLADMVPTPPVLAQVIGGLDCACQLLSLVQNYCASDETLDHLEGVLQSFWTGMDCGSDFLDAISMGMTTLPNLITEIAATLNQEINAAFGAGKCTPVACIGFYNNCM